MAIKIRDEKGKVVDEVSFQEMTGHAFQVSAALGLVVVVTMGIVAAAIKASEFVVNGAHGLIQKARGKDEAAAGDNVEEVAAEFEVIENDADLRAAVTTMAKNAIAQQKKFEDLIERYEATKEEDEEEDETSTGKTRQKSAAG